LFRFGAGGAIAFRVVSDQASEAAHDAARLSRRDGTRFDVVGVGNALVDVIAHAEDPFLHREGLVKGSMTLVETERALHLYRALDDAVEMSGGSAANTMCGVASFGGRAAYIGKVSADDLGDVFGHDLRAVGVSFHAGHRADSVPTGRCIIVVTPDAQRTMNTYLGVSSLLCIPDIDESVVAEGRVLYMEGYLFDRDDAKAAFRHAASVAHAAGRKVSLTLSDSFCVDRHRADFQSLVSDDVDILFGNESELLSLYETDSLDEALHIVRRECAMVAITLGADGSRVLTPDGDVHVPAEPVERVLDTTGAGDLYAAGFLHGLTTGRPLAECGRLGSLAAAEVISHIGPRPLVELRSLIGDD
jgi:sugar/nucleoside kinase (ribokinase family)